MRENTNSLDSHLVHASTTLHRSRSRRGKFESGLAGGPIVMVKGMLRSMRSQWRCLKHTGWSHETDLHSGACRYCGTRTGERL